MSERLDEIAARLAKATPGPWKIIDGRIYAELGIHGQATMAFGHPVQDQRFVADLRNAYEPESNSPLIAHAPTDLAWAHDEIVRLRAENARLLARLKAAEAVCEVVESRNPEACICYLTAPTICGNCCLNQTLTTWQEAKG